MRIKMDTEGSKFTASKEPEPVLDMNTNAPKVDKSGKPIYSVQLVALNEGGAEVLSVKVPGKPVGIVAGTAVRVTALTATPWSVGDRNGVSFTADRIEPITK